jgi:hypothetical protein
MVQMNHQEHETAGEAFGLLLSGLGSATAAAGRLAQALEERRRKLLGPLETELERRRHQFDRVAGFADGLRRAVELVGRRLEALPAEYKMLLAIFAKEGWYLDPYLPVATTFQLADLYIAGDSEEAEAELCEWFGQELDRISRDAQAQFPHRAQIIAAAVAAHRSGMYTLSVPALLIQADGMCHDVTRQRLYSRDHGTPVLRKYIASLDLSTLSSALLEPLISPTPLTASSTEPDASSAALNRHAILHGECVDYGTVQNGCRAVSLVSYVPWVLGHLEPLSCADGVTPITTDTESGADFGGH